MAKPKVQPRSPLMVRIPADLVERIDAIRDLVPRETYIRRMLDDALKQHPKTTKRRTRVR
jgi:hypothetical protein